MGVERTLEPLDTFDRRATRNHAICLCCPPTVAPFVAEVARGLEGLGFETSVLTGAEPGAPLGERAGATDGPTVFVACLVGSRRDMKLGPLRQALATRAGDEGHLLVGVLDISLPLLLVGEIRHFCEGLERAPGRARRDLLGERRQWRQSLARTRIADDDTRSHRATPRSGPPSATALRNRARPLADPGVAIRVAPSRKYRALTGRIEPPAESAGTVAPTKASHRTRDPIPRPAPGGSSAGSVAVKVAVSAAVTAVFCLSAFNPARNRPMSPRQDPVLAVSAGLAPASESSTPSGAPRPAPPRAAGSPEDSLPEAHPPPESERSAQPASTPVPHPPGDAGQEPAQPASPDEEPERAHAAAPNSVRATKRYLVASPSRTRSSWVRARRQCANLSIGGVEDWRLPFRRELQMLGAVGMLTGSGGYWSRSLDPTDRTYAYVYAKADRTIAAQPKSDRAKVVCVRPREDPASAAERVSASLLPPQGPGHGPREQPVVTPAG